MLMTLSEQERSRIREEELVRLQARKEMKRQDRPQLLWLMIIWTACLAVLAVVTPHFH
jgi:hypothetical protein